MKARIIEGPIAWKPEDVSLDGHPDRPRARYRVWELNPSFHHRGSMIPVAIVLLTGLSGSVLSPQAAFTPERSSPAGSRRYATALVVAVDPRARTITVRSAVAGRDETFPVEAQALRRAGVLAPGQKVVITLRAGGAGRPEVVTRIERPVRGVGARPAPRGAEPSPAISPSPSPQPSRLPTDTVGPLRDPRVAPNTDPRQNPLRDPRVVPGLSEPVPTPTPTATPTPPPR
jgi:hypothetical protein